MGLALVCAIHSYVCAIQMLYDRVIAASVARIGSSRLVRSNRLAEFFTADLILVQKSEFFRAHYKASMPMHW